MVCDSETGTCEVPGSTGNDKLYTKSKPVQILYFTDPICSSCWGIEPQLRKLKLEYGNYFDIEYRMGGLLKGWDVYGGKDVNGPASVAAHWDEASAHYDMPIDGDVWLEDPMDSSYPASIAFKAAQLQDKQLAIDFLRRIREMLFLQKKNISRREHLVQAARETGLDVQKFQNNLEGTAKVLFEQDLFNAKLLGVRGFPTIFLIDEEGNRELVYGSKSYEHYREKLLNLIPGASPEWYNKDAENLFSKFPTLTVKEFSLLANMDRSLAEGHLEGFVEKERLQKLVTKNGALYIKK